MATSSAIVLKEEAGKRIDQFLLERGAGGTRSAIQKLFERGLVTRNEKPAQKGDKVQPGDSIGWEELVPESLLVEAQAIPLCIVYEDAQLLVVNKPAGMVVHPAAGNWDKTLVNALLAHCGESLSGINGVIRPGIIHRIDKDTSGLLLVAKTNEAHISLSGQVKEHSVTREYRAVVYGKLKETSGEINLPIGRHKTERKKMCVTNQNAKDARTFFEVIEQLNGFCYVKCKLFTGRTHQIRVHMSHLGHPIAGDKVYGPKKDATGLKTQLLHAHTIGFIHPISGEYMEFHAEVPDYFSEFVRKKKIT